MRLQDGDDLGTKLAVGPIFQGGNGKPLNLDNLARRLIIPAIQKCVKCKKSKAEHKPEGHMLELDKTLQWRGWHGFRRGLATNLHAIHVDDKTSGDLAAQQHRTHDECVRQERRSVGSQRNGFAWSGDEKKLS